MIIIHFFEDIPNMADFIKEIYPDIHIDFYYNILHITNSNRVREQERLTVAIHSTNTQPIEEVDTFLRLKYSTYDGYTTKHNIPYTPHEDYTCPMRKPGDEIVAIVGSKGRWF